MMAKLPPMAPDGPFHPEERDAHEDERNQVGDEECAPAVLRGLRRKAKEIPETHRVAGHREDEPDAAAPAFATCHDSIVLRRSGGRQRGCAAGRPIARPRLPGDLSLPG